MITSGSGVYKITNVVTDKFYIGSAVNLRSRMKRHRLELVKNQHCNRHLQNSWNKYGETNFTFEILELCKKEQLIEREQYHIDNEKPAYNICPVAGSCLGVKHTVEVRAKASAARKGKPSPALGHKHTDETKRRMAESKKGERNGMYGKRPPNFGKSMSEELKQKISGKNNHNFGKPVSEEQKRKISEALMGRHLTEEHRRKISGENHHMFGKHIAEDSKLKQSQAMTGRHFTEEHKRKLSEAGMGEHNSNYGKHISEEQKRKLSAAHKGKPLSEEHKRKLSEAKKGKPRKGRVVVQYIQ